MTELKKEKVQQQMKLDELAADPAAMRVKARWVCEAQELHEQFVMMQEEVEKAEEENRALKLRVAGADADGGERERPARDGSAAGAAGAAGRGAGGAAEGGRASAA